MTTAMESPRREPRANVQSVEAANTPKSTTTLAQIVLSETAAEKISEWACALTTGQLEYSQLPDSLKEFYTFAYLDGHEQRQAEIDALNFTADRLYAEMCRRVPPRQTDPPSYADLERRRGNPEHAGQIDKANMRRFAEVNS